MDRLSRASINRIAAQRTMVAMHACVDLPRKINTSTELSTRGNCSIRGGTDDFSHFEIVGENRGLSRHCVADGSQRDGFASMEDFVCVIRFLLFVESCLCIVEGSEKS